MVFAYIILMRTSFPEIKEKNVEYFTLIDIMLMLYGFIDILKTLNTGIFIEGKIVESRAIILKKYVE